MKADRRKNFPKSMRAAYRVWGALVSLVDFVTVYGKDGVRFTFKNGMEAPTKTE